jgi:hypothetical protein
MPPTKELLRALAKTIREIVSDAILSNKVVPGEGRAFQWKLNDFNYDDSGVKVSGTQGDYVSQRTWFRAWEVLELPIKAHDSFKDALNALRQNYPTLPVAEWLGKITIALIGAFLPEGDKSGKAEDIVDRFLNDLEEGPVTHTAQVYLQGVALRSDAIDIQCGVRIRKPQKEELEIPIPAELAEVFPRYPSAIVEIESVGARERSPQLLQAQVEQCVALLRLFRVGSVKLMHYQMGCSSIVNPWPHGRLTSGDKNPPLESYVIKTEDEPNLKRFWQTMNVNLPKDIYGFEKKVNHVTLAYDRYCDALLLNGVSERRIANVVMALEALFLKETEKQELSYRLSVRVSKLISLILNQNPLEVRSTWKDAYGVRSAFAHGGHLTNDRKRRIEGKYGSIGLFLLRLLDHLRVSIIASILCRIGKDALINLVDNALLDAQEHERLKRVLADTAALIS